MKPIEAYGKVLKALKARDGQRFLELSKSSGIPPSVLSPCLESMEASNLVSIDRRTKKWCLNA